jgi:mannose-6-phosphate isomerase-like protein (cupin superfamily)
MKLSRRDLTALLPALAAAQMAPPPAKDKPVLASKTYRFEDLPVVVNGENQTRAVFIGETHTGFPVDLHITELGPGQAPHPSHHHVHEEVLMLQTGQLDVTIKDKVTHATAGSVVYVNSNEEHGWKNPGPGRARYFVMAIGREG